MLLQQMIYIKAKPGFRSLNLSQLEVRMVLVKEISEGISPHPDPHGLKGYDFLWCDVAKVYILAQKLDEPDLLGLLRCLPDNFASIDLG